MSLCSVSRVALGAPRFFGHWEPLMEGDPKLAPMLSKDEFLTFDKAQGLGHDVNVKGPLLETLNLKPR